MSQVQSLERQQAQNLFEPGLRFGRTLAQRWIQYRKMRRTYAILSEMDDYQLADIGLSRSMIMNVRELMERGRS